MGNSMKKSAKKRLWRLIIIQVFMAVMLIGYGCSGGGGGDDSNGNGDDPLQTDVIDCTGDNPDPKCGEDADSDGLTYKQETEGWEVWPDKFGLGLGAGGSGQTDAHYLITSDPKNADTDGDGLDDYEEFYQKTDPRKIDTDGDGLTDEEEINRWGTSPVSVDTDGDARGPDGDLAPDTRLFDSNELKIDTKNDPTHSVGMKATSPIQKDTDGDGWSDYNEIVQTAGKGFDPVLADIPLVSIDITGTPRITLIVENTSGSQWDESVEVTDALSTSISSEKSDSRATDMTIGSTAEVGTEIGWEAGAEGWKFVGNLHGSVSASAGFSETTSSSQSVSWTEGQTREAERVYAETSGSGGSESVTVKGGYLLLPVTIVNNGNITYTLADLRVNVWSRYVNKTSDFIPVLELKREDDLALTFTPGESYTDIIMKSVTDDHNLIRSFLKNPSGLMFTISSYDLKDKDGNSFDFSGETIKQKTALVVIDYSNELSAEHYLVATSPSRSATGSQGITMAAVMNNILEIPYETMTHVAGSGSYQLLSKVRTVTSDSERYMKWLVSTDSVSMEADTAPDFDDILLNAGDKIYLIFVKDQDSDGLPAREERLNGTSDLSKDFDKDGLTDYEEIREGWSVKVEGESPYQAFSKGYSDDYDSDDLLDIAERRCWLDAEKNDTDLDGISDYEELFGYSYEREIDGVKQTYHMVPYMGVVILDGGDGIVGTAVSGDDIAEVGGVGTVMEKRGGIVIRPGANGVIDSVPLETPDGDDFIAINHGLMIKDHPTINCSPEGFATNPLSDDTDGDTIPDGLEMVLDLGSANNMGDYDEYIDTDGDGLKDAVELRGWTGNVNNDNIDFYSDPTSGDSDGDGLPDLLEYLLKTNPKKSDTDGDHRDNSKGIDLTDFHEYTFTGSEWDKFKAQCGAPGVAPDCTLPNHLDSDKLLTNIKHRDTDGDRLSDFNELNGWTSVINGVSKTFISDPLIKDKDGDGGNDYDEKSWGTNPNVPDTDGDMTWDKKERSICGYDYGDRRSRCRDPRQADRKITVTYKTVTYNGECEKPVFGADDQEEVRYSLRIRYPDANEFTQVAGSPYGSDIKVHDKYENLKLNVSRTFFADFGDVFQLAGFVSEIDGDNYDATLQYRPDPCASCPDWLYMPEVDETDDTEFTVDKNLPNQKDFEFKDTGDKCGMLDNWTGFQIYDFTASVTGEIKVE